MADRTEGVSERLRELRSRMALAGADPSGVKVVAVTKGFAEDAVRSAAAAGLVDVGENYANELLDKARRTEDLPLRWHFLGAIQRNKVRSLAPRVHLWQSVARLVEGREIARCSPSARVLVQVDALGRTGRNGCPPDEVPGLAEGLTGLGLHVLGLMTVGPPGDPEGCREVFRTVGALRSRLGLPELSMGMTDDLEVAVQEGSTMVRVGRALFGPRSSPARLRQ